MKTHGRSSPEAEPTVMRPLAQDGQQLWRPGDMRHAWNSFSLGVSRRNQPCQHPDFSPGRLIPDFQVFRSARDSVSVVCANLSRWPQAADTVHTSACWASVFHSTVTLVSISSRRFLVLLIHSLTCSLMETSGPNVLQ